MSRQYFSVLDFLYLLSRCLLSQRSIAFIIMIIITTIIITVETLGVFSASAVRLLNDLGRRIFSISGHTRETSHLYQRVSVLVQRFNAVLLHDSLPVTDCTD